MSEEGGPVTLAVTGPLACGKSTFVAMLGELGAETISADGVVHDLMATDAELIEKIVRRFGEHVRGERGIDRRALGREVFSDRRALEDLEEMVHPLVWREVGRRISASRAPLFVAEVPLLFEGKHASDFDFTLTVLAPRERRLGWARERGMPERQFEAVEARQLSAEEKARRADIVVNNDGGMERLREQSVKVWGRLLSGGGRGR